MAMFKIDVLREHLEKTLTGGADVVETRPVPEGDQWEVRCVGSVLSGAGTAVMEMTLVTPGYEYALWDRYITLAYISPGASPRLTLREHEKMRFTVTGDNQGDTIRISVLGDRTGAKAFKDA